MSLHRRIQLVGRHVEFLAARRGCDLAATDRALRIAAGSILLGYSCAEAYRAAREVLG